MKAGELHVGLFPSQSPGMVFPADIILIEPTEAIEGHCAKGWRVLYASGKRTMEVWIAEHNISERSQ